MQLLLRSFGTRLNLLSRTSVRNIATNSPRPSTQSRSPWPRRLLYIAIFGALGKLAGDQSEKLILHPITPGSAEDEAGLESIRKVFDALPMVQKLRENPDYVETEAYENFSEEKKRPRLTSGPMAGARGLGLQKVFWNDKDRELVNVVFFGPGLDGWPSMVHGGAIGTVIDESLGRAAIRHFPVRTGVTANLNINYRAPVYSSRYYAFRTKLDQERSTDRKAYATCEVRDSQGRLCVEASGLFVVPKKFQLAEIGDRF
ncbi:hypothetical protein N7468_000658 [Penicillium chermesinum]|uniref:Thioesterase domain-containing protein n=1 Tax=Penicillium chermesinum TaxID=63820 RepID=A0A9W9PKQ1_9EURO|nr:uncharacterized protein N7468_000658 [Penicillium chermesinum]KAJ5249207.1 hypothetical protein N7468_000658 [Penicillium chermesinum]KAJ6151300.1 hypothetical protein N7470_007894 [Penicillium chermesinum]